MKITKRNLSIGLAVVCSAIFLSGCETMQARVLDSSTNKSAVQLRSMQSRAFETTDRQKTMRTVIATLQDLSFVVDKADMELGSISATKLDGYALRMTVSVRPHSEKRVIVRANAQFNITPVTEPKPYQDFFVALEKAMFLTAQQVE
jgi:PBP1b-binding outer membrane lipoprotein LpoB